ncbi:hypothetical protein PTTG_07411 [Puccinia triticina 1-1 BBBD Race 1]|uniref:FAD/NAD(P)-binding domain-containing protein n=2 Tax=Puccinia triticina TaxID=208348 RepID=A0A180GIZ7_PUCT1|nr:uncharacterized protein PtA15_1A706 [Puccinia triticina]OAV91923.1 hypothetical protein PTTG_07411 [Puccinia triticina 1-1 BBBD Race 1]WAQ81366.1 hypothetical protein PtA15_1A706 [Puccinia triticina]WAR52249.1 hypothetical protein PtB15_1B690 [Puccinia triticina]
MMGNQRTRKRTRMEEETDVVVIGAGASGLAALKQLTTTTELKVVCFEARSGPAGVWNPESTKGDGRVGFDWAGVPSVEPPPIDASPVYAGLHTNVPKQLMAFHGQPFVTEHPASSFPPGHEVSTYLLEAARGLEPLIRFNSLVQRVAHHHPPPNCNRRWIVEVHPRSKPTPAPNRPRETTIVYCDFVLVASGHYNVPYVPFIPSLSTWPKEIIHACAYTSPSDAVFQHKTVAVIGIGPSGYDILRELAMRREQEQGRGETGGKKLYSVASHPAKMGWDFGDPAAPSWTRQITRVPRVARIEGGKLWLVDGRPLEDVDLLCFATGYLYDFPFCRPHDPPWAAHPLTLPPPLPPTLLPPDPAPSGPPTLSKPGLRVHHLDRTQLFFYPDPSLAFLVLVHQAVPFPVAEHQARAVAARWSGRRPFALHPMDDEHTESKEVHAMPPPKEFEYENLLLDCIGEGAACHDDQACWKYVPAWKYKAREDTAANRRLELGY